MIQPSTQISVCQPLTITIIYDRRNVIKPAANDVCNHI